MEINGLGSYGSDLDLGRITNLDVTAFLNLLTTQMRYQNPLAPQTDTEFLSQMASLSMVQELRDLNTQTAYASQAEVVAQASSLIGKVVEGTSIYTGLPVKGVVSEIQSDGFVTVLIVGDDAIEISCVQRAYDPTPDEGVSESDLERAALLVGSEITGVLEDGAVVSGTVQGVRTEGTQVYLEIEIPPGEEGEEPTRASVEIGKLVRRAGADPAEALSQCSWLLGHAVTALDPDNAEDPEATFSGTVEGVRLANGVVLLQIDGKEVALDALREVK